MLAKQTDNIVDYSSKIKAEAPKYKPLQLPTENSQSVISKTAITLLTVETK